MAIYSHFAAIGFLVYAAIAEVFIEVEPEVLMHATLLAIFFMLQSLFYQMRAQDNGNN